MPALPTDTLVTTINVPLGTSVVADCVTASMEINRFGVIMPFSLISALVIQGISHAKIFRLR